MIPLAFDYKMHFVPQLSITDGHQEVEICDLQKGTFLEKAQNTAATHSEINACSTMLNYLGKITIFGSNSKNTGLYSLDTNKRAWIINDFSEFPFQNINFNNCVCYKDASDNIVVVTVLETFAFIYLFSTSKDDNACWKFAKFSLSKSNCEIQSCVVISENLFCSLLTSTHLLVYQFNLTALYQSTSDDLSSLEPVKSWILEKLNLKCFLSSLKEEVVTIMVKKAGNKTFVEFSELKHFNSGSLEPLTFFDYSVEVTFATVIPYTTNLGIVYYDSNVYKMCLLNGKS